MDVKLVETELNQLNLTLVFDCLKDPVRRKLVEELVRKPIHFTELCWGKEVSEGTVRYHLKTLEVAGVVGRKKSGKYVFYFLKRKSLQEARAFLDEILKTERI